MQTICARSMAGTMQRYIPTPRTACARALESRRPAPRSSSVSRSCHWLCFFFQAEDGIRDLTVTGVQTCALPIYHAVLIFEVDGSAPSSHGDTSTRGDIVPGEVGKVPQVIDAPRGRVIGRAHIDDGDSLDRELMQPVAVLELTVTPGIADADSYAAALQGHGPVGCSIVCGRGGRISLVPIRG